MSAFAFYRLPYKDHYTLVMLHDDDPEKLNSVNELNGKHGFVIAPFMPSEECPILLMRPDVVKHFPIQAVTTDNKKIHFPESVSEKEAYQKDFEDFHQQLTKGIFDKIVLARCSHQKSPEAKGLKAEELFKKACQMYPRLFIALVSTTQSGTWLMATPEILLSGNGCEFKTMALAGTHTGEETVWTKKEQEEQQYVSDYIEDVISEFTDEYSKKGPFTTMAANLYHLRTDFLFRLEDTDCLGEVLDALFPTPAICGIPKEETRQYILDHESINRKYYSGFVGPLMPSGETQLYVSLRCMNIHQGGSFQLYAGGGLLAESEMQKEWEETEAKLGTMRAVISK